MTRPVMKFVYVRSTFSLAVQNKGSKHDQFAPTDEIVVHSFDLELIGAEYGL